MERTPVRLRFSVVFLLGLLTGFCFWFAGYRYGFRSATDNRMDLAERSAQLVELFAAEKPTTFHSVYNVSQIVAHRGAMEGSNVPAAEFDNLIQRLTVVFDEQLESQERQQISVMPYPANLCLVITAGEEGHELAAQFLQAKRRESAAATRSAGGNGSR